MPDVGVLNLQIRDDSNEAAGGLDQLVSKLRSLSKIASTKNEGLGNVAQHIRDIVNATKIDDSKVTASMKNIATIINSFSGLTKLNGISKLNVKPIKDLKAVIGTGFNIGQAGTQINRIREALTGEWNTDNARTARDSMKAIATGAEALEKSKAATTIGKVAESLEKYNSALAAQKEKEAETQEVLGRYTGDPTKSGLLSLNLQQFGRKKGGMSEGQTKMDLDAIGKWTEGFTEIKTVVETAKEPVEEFNNAIKETASITRDTNLKEFMVDPVTQLMDRFRNCADASETFGRSFDTAAYSTNLMKSEAIIASKNVEMLKNRLETPIKWRGLNEMVNHLNGVGRGFLSAKESADVFANTPIGETAKDLHGVEEIVQNIASHETNITGVAKACTEIMGSGENGKGPNLDFSVFDPSKLPLDALGVKLDESSQNWYKYGESVKETFDIVKNAGALDTVKGSVQEVGETVNAIIPYNENLENTWGRIVERIDEANRMAEEARVIRERQEREFYASSGPKDVAYTTAIAESLTQLDLLEAKLREAQDAYNDLFNKEGPGSSKTIKKGLEVQKAEEDIERFVASMENARSRLSNIDISPRMSIAETNDIAQGITELDMYRAKFEDAQYTYNRLVNEFGVGDARTMQAALSMQNLAKHVEELEAASASGQSAFSQLLSSMEETIFGANRLRGALKKMFPTLSGVLSRFKNIAKYRFLRTVLKQITSGAREGLENVYRYSQIVGTGFAPAMDSAASALAQMRNSVGAALAPALQALIPLLNNIVNAFINVINVVNQFFSLLAGSPTWTRALPQVATAFDDIKKSAKGAGSATKDLLADWDELNIIQSNGGSGSGGTGKEIPDYANMFEEVANYDERVSGVIDIIKNGFGDIWGLAKSIGLLLLGWKVSKAFGGLVGKLGSLLAGLELIHIGVEFSFGSSFNAGKKGFFDVEDFIGVVAGGLATALGGSLITSALGLGGGVGFVIGLTAAIVVDIVGFYMGKADAEDAAKWGDVHYTAEQIDDIVKKQFTFPVDAEIDVMKAHIADETTARNAVQQAFEKFNESLGNAERVVADVDIKDEKLKINAVKQAAEDAVNAINAMQSLIDTNVEGLTFTLTNFKFTNLEGVDITDDIMNNIKNGTGTLNEYLNGVGRDIANAILDGEKNGWDASKMEAALYLMKTQQDIAREAERLLAKNKLITDIKTGNSGVIDRDTALAEQERQRQLLEEYRETARAQVQQDINDLEFEASYAEAASKALFNSGDYEGAEKMRKAADELMSSAIEINKNFDKAVEAKLSETKEIMAKEWEETLRRVYGENNYAEIVSDVLGGYGFYDPPSTLEKILNPGSMASYLSPEGFKKHGAQITAEKLRQNLINYFSLPSNDIGGFNTHFFELGGNPFNLLTDELRGEILKKLYEATQDETIAEDIFRSAFGLSNGDVEYYSEKYLTDAGEKIKEATSNAASNLNMDEYLRTPVENAMPDEIDIPMPDIKKSPIQMEFADDDFDIWDVNDLIPNPYGEYTSEAPAAEVEVQTAMTFTTDDLAQSLYDAYSSNGLSVDEIEDIIGQYDIPIGDIIRFVGHSNFFDDDVIRSEIIDMLEKSGSANVDPNFVAKKFVRSGQIVGSAGFSDVGYNGYNGNAETGVTREENKQDIAGGVANGTAALATTLNAILQVAQAINRKPFTATINPTAAVARGVNASIGMLGNVTGDIP